MGRNSSSPDSWCYWLMIFGCYRCYSVLVFILDCVGIVSSYWLLLLLVIGYWSLICFLVVCIVNLLLLDFVVIVLVIGCFCCWSLVIGFWSLVVAWWFVLLTYWLLIIGCCLVVCVVGEEAAVLFPAFQVVAAVCLVDTYPSMQK